MQIHWTPIKEILTDATNIRTWLLERPPGFTWQEGARTHLGLPGFNVGEKPNRGLVRHMSIASTPQEDMVAITTRLPEPCSEFKQVLQSLEAGTQVALFKTGSHLPLERTGQRIYLLSQGVGLATFRAHVLAYLRDASGIAGLHSLNVASAGEALYQDVFQPRPERNFTARYVHGRADFQAEVQALARDATGLFYVVGSDAFLMQTIELLRTGSVDPSRIRLDKHAHEMPQFLGTASLAMWGEVGATMAA